MICFLWERLMAEDTKTGWGLEKHVEMIFEEYGAHVQDHGVNQGNGDLFEDFVLTRNSPYRNIYGGRSRSEFVCDIRSREFQARIECKWQESSGSVDEKFPYVMLNAENSYPEPHVWLIVDGGGAKGEAVEWLKNAAANSRTKDIKVFSLSEFRSFLRRFMK
jgi:hypothetical protein